MIALKSQPDPARSFPRQPIPALSSGHAANSRSLYAGRSPGTGTETVRRIENLLVATDFSAGSTEAVAQAVALARDHDAKLTILHVVDINPSAALNHCGTAESLMRQLWITGISELCRLTEVLATSQIKPQTIMVEGLLAEAIVENSSGFDLLVIGEKRSKSAWDLFSRHTARHVIEHAQCPTLVVPQEKGLAGRRLGEARAAV